MEVTAAHHHVEFPEWQRERHSKGRSIDLFNVLACVWSPKSLVCVAWLKGVDGG
jgi:hypothetical protein